MGEILFRAMEPDTDGAPKVGSAANMLGARPSVDMKRPHPAHGHPKAGPGCGGPSGSVNDWTHMPASLRPKEFGGHHSLNRMYVAEPPALVAAKLDVRTTNPATNHAVIEAAHTCEFETFQQMLASTRPGWTPAAGAPQRGKP